MSVLQVSVSKLREQGGRASARGELPREAFQEGLGESASLAGPIEVELFWSLEGGDVELTGKVSGRWKVPCSRCLTGVDEPYQASVEGAFPATTETCDAADEIRQALLLAVPMRAHCKPDCKGLCLRCGKNRNLTECGHKDNA